MANKKNKGICIKLDADLVNEFRAILKEHGISQTFVIEKAIKETIKELSKQHKSNPKH